MMRIDKVENYYFLLLIDDMKEMSTGKLHSLIKGCSFASQGMGHLEMVFVNHHSNQ